MKRISNLEVTKDGTNSTNSTNGPPSPSVTTPRSIKSPSGGVAGIDTSGSSAAQVLSPSKITAIGMGSLRQKPTTSPISAAVLKNTFSGIPRRNTYNYNNEKSASTEKAAIADNPRYVIHYIVY
jgi:hypothetical protein